MKKFLIGLVAGLLLAGLTAVIGFFVAVKLGDSKPSISDGSTLVVRLSGDIPEKSPVDIPLPFFEGQKQLAVHEVWDALRKAAADPRIKALILLPQRPGIGWGKMQEIREDLLKFKKSGKPVFVYLRAPGTRDYYLASVADKIYMTPEDLLDMKGLRLEAMYIKGALDKLGVTMEFEHVGKYKDAPDMFTRNNMSPETKEVLNSVLDGLNEHLLSTLGAARKKSTAEMQAIMDDGPFIAKNAVAKGLVDELLYEDQFYDVVKKKLDQKELKKVGIQDYLRGAGTVAGVEGKSHVALLVGDGAITRGSSSDAFGNDEGITSGAMTKQLRQVRNDDSIKAVILRIDSPGGDAIASDEILREVKLLSQKKPLVISMSDVAASGGYYISMSGDTVVAYPNTLTGSIGVFFGKVNLKGLYDKLGIQKETLKRGQFADIDSDYQPMTPATRAKLREGIDEIYKTFVGLVAESRKKKFEEINEVAQGRVWLGTQGKGNGLVDELGGIDKAIELVKAKAKIPANENVKIVVFPPKKSLFDQLMNRSQPDASVEALLQKYTGIKIPKAWLETGMKQMMPYTIEVK
jgi:protease-4